MALTRHFNLAENYYAEGYWHEAELHYQMALEAFDRHLNPSRRNELDRAEAIRQLRDISLAMGREDDAEIRGSLLKEKVPSLGCNSHKVHRAY
jgi:tetratricopeptide (TPR) repeat protein